MQLSVFYLPTSSLSARCFRVPVSIREAAFCLATSSLSDCCSRVSDSIPSSTRVYIIREFSAKFHIIIPEMMSHRLSVLKFEIKISRYF